jgi:poly(A) polymerase
MTAHATRAVVEALEVRGGPGCARFVGGCVRNTLMGLPVEDVDIATVLTPEQVTDAARAAGLKPVPTGVEHGTVTVVSGGKPFEVTTLRRDVETDGRRAVVAFTTDWNEDAQRRDFRLNAVYAAFDGALFDPTGAGVADARDGRIVFVGDAGQRIREDYLRILRFFRFFAWYGKGEPDPRGLAACASLKGGLNTLSAERVSKELLKLLAADDPRPAVRLMRRSGVLAEVLPEVADIWRFERLVALERDRHATPDAELRLAALLPRDPEAAADAAARLRLSNAQAERLVAAARPMDIDLAPLGPVEVRRALYRLGPRAFSDQVQLAAAAAPIPPRRLPELLAAAAVWRRPALPVTGEDAVALGLPPGPNIGEALREVERWWIEAGFPRDRAAALERLRQAAARLGA